MQGRIVFGCEADKVNAIVMRVMMESEGKVKAYGSRGSKLGI